MKKDDIQQEALDKILQSNKGSVNISMGVGKTLLGLKYINHYRTHNLKVLVVAPKVSIFNAWVDEMSKHNMIYLRSNIEFTTYLSLHKQDLDYDILVLDEIHSLIQESHEEWLSQFKGKILGLTGTRPRSDSDKGRMIAKYCPIRYEYTMDKAVEDNILNDYRIIVHSLSLDKNKTLKKKTKSGGFWVTSEVAEYNYWNSRIQNAKSDREKLMTRIMRMKSIMSFPTKEIYTKKLVSSISEKVIIFANDIAQCERLCKDTYHSKNSSSEDNLERFKEGSISRLGCIQQLSEGANIPGLKEGIIIHSFSGDSPKSKQKFGRLCRLPTDETATLHVLRYINTIDEKWLDSVLDQFDPTRITYK